ncbi:MAG: Uncharacterized protein CEO12_223 [Parcubacteria group bacterium Gr01-1014_46]|nr:MAG: Uncharacterized protein CEO12_223 [Parcubacteria group bacterium Gr01-1014_46]
MTTTKNILKYGILVGLFIIPFIPFIVPGTMFFPFITGKGFTFRILIEIVFGLFVALALMEPAYRPRMTRITKAVFLFTFVVLIADLFGANPYKSLWSNFERMEGFVLIIHLLLYYVVLSSVLNTKSLWNKYLNTTIGASVLMSFYAVLQLAGKFQINQGIDRVDARLGNASYFAIYLVFHIFLSIYMIVDEATKKWLKWTYGVIVVFEIIILYFTATRGAILGIIGGLMFTGLLIAWKERENKILKKAGYSILGLMAILVLGFILLRNTPMIKNSPVLSRFSTLGTSEFKTQGRYFVWPMALKGIAERPVLGWGQENFNFVFNKNYNPNMFGQEEWFDRTHNVVLDWLIAGGILGFSSYALIYLAFFYYVWRKESLLTISQKSILSGMMIAYVFHNLFVFDNLISYIMFFTVLALIHYKNKDTVDSGGSFYTKTFGDESVNYIVFPLVAILTVGSVYFVNIPPLKANTTLIQAISPQKEGVDENLKLFKEVFAYNSFADSEAVEQLVTTATQIMTAQSGISDAQKQAFYDLARTKVEEKVAQSPKDARYLVFAGSFFNRFGQHDEAIKYLERALIESPKKQTIYFELGTSYLGKKDYKKAFELLKTAYELKPSSRESQILYALGAIYTKNEVVLKELSTKLDPDTIVYDNRFLNTYANIGDYGSAINILNARLLKDPKNKDSKLSLASVYATIGQKQKAVSILREIIADDPSFKDQGEFYINQILSQ